MLKKIKKIQHPKVNADRVNGQVDLLVIPPPITKHNLPFEVGEWNCFLNDKWLLFRVGTCEGQWSGTDPKFYEILSIINSEKGNGHLDDVFEWFEYSCKRDKKALVIREIWNKGFYKHLLTKRGFQPFGKEDAIKHFVAV